jgi:prephenate dehydrogenase|tara:strand:+ start:4422 stop:4565 length:144 start_codon:yes stop_codon:yes gene_type:complete
LAGTASCDDKADMIVVTTTISYNNDVLAETEKQLTAKTDLAVSKKAG